MKSIIQLVFSAVFLLFITTNIWALESTQTINEDGQVVETFYINADSHLIALTAGPAGILKPFPPSVQYLYEPNIADGLTVLSKVADSSGEVVGFTTEVEHFITDAAGNVTVDEQWMVKVPGRGAVMVTHIEDPSTLFGIIQDMVTNGETERYIEPPIKVPTTIPGTGKIVGGVGVFEGLSGTFTEYNEFSYLNLEDGTIGINLVLEITYDKKYKDKDK
ncbi:MAG: hypothetical protein OEV42_15890 [Deltaproteobacteria bacterium]|nr:hypothetical protein [Deltaproteobacteria bacterium]